MMRREFAVLMAVFPLLFVIACNQDDVPRKYTSAPEVTVSTVPDTSNALAAGPVIETMNSGGYTYVLVDGGGSKIWAAAPECVVSVGDQVVVPAGAPMPNFHSETLDRDFELVYFVNAIQSSVGEPLPKGKGVPAGHSSMAGKSPPTEVDVSGVEKAEGGKTVAEIYGNKADLSNKEVTVRGKVVKFNAQIMGKNWLHVRDGSGDAETGTNDLTVTTDVAARIGDTVLVTGVIHLDKDFGYGYKYDVIIEDAQVVVE
jgi:hypothetical protein